MFTADTIGPESGFEMGVRVPYSLTRCQLAAIARFALPTQDLTVTPQRWQEGEESNPLNRVWNPAGCHTPLIYRPKDLLPRHGLLCGNWHTAERNRIILLPHSPKTCKESSRDCPLSFLGQGDGTQVQINTCCNRTACIHDQTCRMPSVCVFQHVP